LPDSFLGVGFIDHADGLEMFGFRKAFRGLDRCGKLVRLRLVPLPLLERFQETNEVPDLPGVQSELGHARMTRHNPLGKRLFERLNRVPLVKGSKRRSNGQGTLRDLID
jgi:hypothetical protein